MQHFNICFLDQFYALLLSQFRTISNLHSIPTVFVTFKIACVTFKIALTLSGASFAVSKRLILKTNQTNCTRNFLVKFRSHNKLGGGELLFVFKLICSYKLRCVLIT